MLHYLDETLAELILDSMGRPGNLSVSFAAPDKDFPPSGVGTPALDLFLYDIRENLELRSNERAVNVRDGRVYSQPAPVRIDCSYLITAWPSETAPEEEHRLLGQVLRVLLRHRQLPEEVLQGDLVGHEPPIRARVAGDGRLQSLGEFWQAMGGKPKASLQYTVTVGLEIFDEEDLGVATSTHDVQMGAIARSDSA